MWNPFSDNHTWNDRVMHGVSKFEISRSKLKSVSRIEKTSKQGDFEDAREITAVWTYFRDNQVEQLFKILKRNCKGR